MAILIKGHNAVILRIVDPVGENARALVSPRGAGQQFGQAVAVKQIVSQHERARVTGNEIGPDVERLRQTFGVGLHRIAERNAEIRTIAQHALELRLIFGRGDDEDIANARQH